MTDTLLATRDSAPEIIREQFGAFLLDGRVVVLAEMGSTSHGTNRDPIDDYDLMGVVVPPERYLTGLGIW